VYSVADACRGLGAYFVWVLVVARDLNQTVRIMSNIDGEVQIHYLWFFEAAKVPLGGKGC
jgi:hypothetical protein